LIAALSLAALRTYRNAFPMLSLISRCRSAGQIGLSSEAKAMARCLVFRVALAHLSACVRRTKTNNARSRCISLGITWELLLCSLLQYSTRLCTSGVPSKACAFAAPKYVGAICKFSSSSVVSAWSSDHCIWDRMEVTFYGRCVSKRLASADVVGLHPRPLRSIPSKLVDHFAPCRSTTTFTRDLAQYPSPKRGRFQWWKIRGDYMGRVER